VQGIYCIEHIDSGRKYIGSSTNINKRLSDHKKGLISHQHHNILLQRAVDKYGIESFNFYIIEETNFLSRKELLSYEQLFLDKNIGGYNIAPANGGDCISNHPNKLQIIEKAKISNNKRLQRLTAEERKLKYGNAGQKNGMYGKTHNNAVKNQARLRAIGNSYAKGVVRSDQFKEKISKSMKGRFIKEKNHFYGKHHSEETKQKLRNRDYAWIKGIDPSLLPYTKRYQITYSNGETRIFAGLKAIADEFNVSIENVHATIKRIKAGNIPKRGVFAGLFLEEI
jgi:group I intron endonuclease